MKAIIYISGLIGKETTLVDVIRQYKGYEDPTEVELKIHSEGGDVEEGDKIYNYFDNLKKTIPVNTEATKAYSISAKIFSVGTERVVEDGDKRIMIHFAWGSAKGKAETFEKVAKVLRGLEDEFATYYSEFLSVDEDTVRGLLDTNTFLSAEEAVELGFATEIKEAVKAVAVYNPNIKEEKMTKMSKKTKFQTFVSAAADMFNITEDVQVNALELQDSSGTTIDFPDVEDGENPVVGSVGNIDGSPVEDGEYIMPSLENKILVFVDGKVSEIKEAVVEEETEVEIQARLLREEKIRIAAEEVQQISVWTQEATNTSFEVGDQMTYEFDGETFPYSAGEYFVPSLDKNVVTDASGVIVAHKDKVVVSTVDEVVETTEAAQASFDAEMTGLQDKIEASISAKYEKKFTTQAAEMEVLKRAIGSKEINAVLETEETGIKKEKGVNSLATAFRTQKSGSGKK